MEWRPYTYRWNTNQTDADLLSEEQTEVLWVKDPKSSTGRKELTWVYPGESSCLRCHTLGAGFVLGVHTLQANRNFSYPKKTDNQIRVWDHIGLFHGSAWDPGLPTFPGAAANVGPRARAYLDANCSQCHRPFGGTPLNIDMRYATPFEKMGLSGVAPTEGDLGIKNVLRLTPGFKDKSLVWERMRRLDDKRMPPLASHRVDEEALWLIGEWIDSMLESSHRK